MLAISIILSLLFLTGMLWLGFKITGTLLSAFFWLFVKLPCALCVGAMGIVLCCTLIFIPLGIPCIKLSAKMLT